MKQKYLIIGGALVAILVVGGIVLATTQKSKTTKVSSSSPYQVREACDILTDKVATELAGKHANTAQNPDEKSKDLNVSSCNYYSAETKTTIGLMIRSPKTKAGADSNANQFAKGLPADAQKVDGFGDSAYWTPIYGQLNIHKNSTWYIVSLGSLKAKERNLAKAEEFANVIKEKL